MKTIKRFLYIKRIQIDVDGLSLLPKTPSLIIANHKSNIDPIALFKILYTHKNSRYNEFE
jgi:1-acyl-sn-glycerol-3-phosphate acyltransferase